MLECDFMRSMARDRELSINQEKILLLRFAEEMDYEYTSPITVVGQASCLPLTALVGDVYSKPPISGDGWINSAD